MERMEKVPKGLNHLWSYRHAGEINTKHRIFTALSGVSCVLKCLASGASRPPKDRPGVALSAAALTGPQSWSPLAVCGSAEGSFSPNDTHNVEMLKDCWEGYFFLYFFFPSMRLTYFPTFCLWLFKNQLGSSAFDSLTILNSSAAYSPTSYIWQTDTAIFIFFSILGLQFLLWATDTCLSKPKILADKVGTAFFPSMTPYIQYQREKIMTERQSGLKITEMRDLALEMVKWQVSLSSTQYYEQIWMCFHCLIYWSRVCVCVCV